MSVKKAKSSHPLDNKMIDIHNKSDYRHWCKELHCTDRELAAAIRQVGGSGIAIREYFEAHQS